MGKRELTIGEAERAYEVTEWVPIDVALAGDEKDREQVDGKPCGCLVGTLYAAAAGMKGELTHEQRLRVYKESEAYVLKTFDVNYVELENGFDWGYMHYHEMLDKDNGEVENAEKVRTENPSSSLGWQIAQAVCAKFSPDNVQVQA